ncbi:chemotaxis protein CheD [Aromatoleum buckelii]|uniref:chemotaxis protein CheD n=1 Tax=Aromatoleum buckelii TaxID=200254 RepID=UPI0031BB8768
MKAINEGRELERFARTIGPGDWAIEATRPIGTLLGSCVSVCLWDPRAKIGGMNHFMLPSRSPGRATTDFDVLLCGDFAMEALMNAMLARGARRERLQAKAFGGGAVVAALTETGIGARNVEFAREWLAREGIPLLGTDFLGPWSRKIVLNPVTGDAFCRRNQAVPAQLVQAEERYGQTLALPRQTAVELF